MPSTLRLVLGDQISDDRLSSLRDLDAKRDTVLLAEVRDEATYVRHHKQKIALVFAGMRGLAERLRASKVKVRYVGYEDDGQHGLADRRGAPRACREAISTRSSSPRPANTA